MTFPTTGQAAKVLQPGEQALNMPAPQVAPEGTAILGAFAFVFAVGCNQLHSVCASQPLVQRITVVRPVANQALGQGGNMALAQSIFDQFRLMRRSACNPHGERKTMAVRNCHDLAPFAAACWTNTIAPFLAPAKEASMKVSSSPSAPRASRSSHNAQSRPSSTPSRCHCWKRRWQVWYEPYRLGRSCHGAPVRKIHSTPFSTWRASLQGRPRPSGRRFWFHSTRGFKCFHCVSVRSAMPLICTNSAHPSKHLFAKNLYEIGSSLSAIN